MVVCCHFQDYMQEEILVDKEEIATPSKIKKWKHLSSITNEIEQRNDVQVGLLIGANCMKVLEPRKIIHWGGPYAYKTRLGWCVVGPINCIRKLQAAIVEQLEMLHHQKLLHITLQWRSHSRMSVWRKCFKQCTSMNSINQNLLELVPC